VIEKILKIHREINFDFRDFVNPSDELSYLFNEWYDSYRLKFAICKALEPKTILEIGFRYGYSAITFLSAVPEARYLGIDNITDNVACLNGGMEWAKKITKNFKAVFLIADTHNMATLPGEFNDLIYINRERDGDRTFYDLELALPKAKWILLEGYFWSKENMLSNTYFLEKYKQFIEYAIIIPSYEGNILIKTKESAKKIRIRRDSYSDQTICEEYDQTYFLQDCGGYDSFKKYQGKQLTDERLLTALYLVSPTRHTSILDIGCGRGELCYALAQAGASVTGIDYSLSAITIAEKTFNDTIKKDKLEFICDDFLLFDFAKKFDRIIATDFIEHIEKNRFDIVLRKVAGLLKPRGLFILHTSPNALNYETPYANKRAIARSIGSYLPKNPRTHYEEIMHINEQTPDLLKTNLEKHFPYSIVWCATPPDIVGSLGRTFSMNETINARSIFAVASGSPLEHSRILNQLIQNPLDTKKITAKISVGSYPTTIAPDEHFFIEITLDNLSDERWVSLPPNPVHLTYHWLDEKGEFLVFEGIRTIIRYPLLPGESRNFLLNVVAPKTLGEYVLQVTMVQEGCFWFENVTRNLPITLMIKTKAHE
jgi:2-polyprenyl-3-methyl-5-hydroxy-6-metoxy-1,4-benzoquinol methylase